MLFGVSLLTVMMQGGLIRRLAPRFGEAPLGSVGIALYALGLLVVAVAGKSLALVLAGIGLAGLGMGAYTPCASALASMQSKGSDRGAVMGTYQASTSLARVIGPFVSGYLYERLGSNSPFFIGALITLPAIWLLLRSRRGALETQPAAGATE